MRPRPPLGGRGEHQRVRAGQFGGSQGAAPYSGPPGPAARASVATTASTDEKGSSRITRVLLHRRAWFSLRLCYRTPSYRTAHAVDMARAQAPTSKRASVAGGARGDDQSGHVGEAAHGRAADRPRLGGSGGRATAAMGFWYEAEGCRRGRGDRGTPKKHRRTRGGTSSRQSQNDEPEIGAKENPARWYAIVLAAPQDRKGWRDSVVNGDALVSGTVGMRFPRFLNAMPVNSAGGSLSENATTGRRWEWWERWLGGA